MHSGYKVTFMQFRNGQPADQPKDILFIGARDTPMGSTVAVTFDQTGRPLSPTRWATSSRGYTRLTWERANLLAGISVVSIFLCPNGRNTMEHFYSKEVLAVVSEPDGISPFIVPAPPGVSRPVLLLCRFMEPVSTRVHSPSDKIWWVGAQATIVLP